MLTVVGVVLDAEGPTPGYVTLDDQGHVVERGQMGAQGKPSHPLVHGIVLPSAVNGHTHLGDAVWRREPPSGPLADIVAPPRGLKHRLLTSTPREAKVGAMHEALALMQASGTAATLDFREEGIDGVRMLQEAAQGKVTVPTILGRPRNGTDPEELAEVLDLAAGLGLSGLRDLDPSVASAMAGEARRRGKLLAVHAFEDAPEPLDALLDLKPSLVIHLCHATAADLERIADARMTAAFCPRSNALFGRRPPLAQASRLGIPFLLGTDNAMFNAPDLFREMEFAYLSSRHHGEAVSAEALVRSVFVTPWNLLGKPSMASLQPGSPASALVLRLPTDDPYYQVCARGSASRRVLPEGGRHSPEPFYAQPV